MRGRGPRLFSIWGLLAIFVPFFFLSLFCRSGGSLLSPFSRFPSHPSPHDIANFWWQSTTELLRRANITDSSSLGAVGAEDTTVSFKNEHGEMELPPFSIEYHGAQVAVWTSLANFEPDKDSVTWITQFTTDRLESFKNLLSRWPGPVSAAIYTRDVANDIELLKPLMGRIDLHVVAGSQGLYPVNTLRNLVIDKCRTEFFIIADVDFVPNIDCFDLITKRLPELRKHEKTVFVLPAFELLYNVQGMEAPKTKKEISPGWIGNFRPVHNDPGRSQAHSPTDYNKWIGIDEPYFVPYIFPFEPYYLARKTIPRFDARFAGYGNDKTVQAYELSAAGFRFLVLPDCFVTHLPHPAGVWIGETVTPQRDRMERLMKDFFEEMNRKYNDIERMTGNGELLPPNLLFRAVVGQEGEDCTSTCKSVNLVCNSNLASQVNSCNALSSNFDCAFGCLRQYYGGELPAADKIRRKCFVNVDGKRGEFQCDTKAPQLHRLCPCSAQQ